MLPPTHHLLTKLPNTTSPIDIFKWPICGAWRCQDWKRTCCRGGTPTPLPGVPCAHVHKWWHRRLIGSPCNLTLVYMLDAPNWIWRGCMWAGISLSTEGAVEEVDSNACSVGTEASGSRVPERADGKWWRRGCGMFSWEEVKMWVERSVILLPSEAHKTLHL